MFLQFAALLLFCSVLSAGEIAGAAMHGGHLITWGGDLLEWNLQTLKSTRLTSAKTARGEGGCIVDGDRSDWGIALEEDHRLVIRRSPRFAAEVVDTNIEMHDCAAMELFGEPALLVIHRFAQLRSYRRPSGPSERWPYTEAYSIYTPSRQGGLLPTEFGVIAGNYWLRIPPDLGRPWREFAINTWSETPDSAVMRFARVRDALIVAQSHLPAARLSRFTPPADVTQLWNEERLADDLRYPHALAADAEDVVVGENAGPGSRVLLFRGREKGVPIATTNGLAAAFIVNGVLLAVGSDGEIRRIPLQRPRR